MVFLSAVPRNAELLTWALPILATQNAAIRIAVIPIVVTQNAATRNVAIHGAAPSVALLTEATLSLARIVETRYAVIHGVVPSAVYLSAAIQFEVPIDFRVALIVVPISVLTSVLYVVRNVVVIPDCHGHDGPHVDSRVAALVVVPVAVP